jgi:DNA-binding MarR family transcriptional regulator
VAPERPGSTLDAGSSLEDAALTLAVAARLLERSLGDMTLPQFRVLSLVASSPERAGRIAAKAAMSRPTLSGLLDGMAARGWVRRSDVDGDRRGVQLELTPEGLGALETARDALAGRVGTLLGHTDDDSRTRALDGIAALGRAIETERETRV